MRVHRLGLVACMVLFIAPGAWAQNQFTHVRGTIQSFDGTTLTVRKIGGVADSFVIPSSARITYNKIAHLSDIRSGDFVASGGVMQSDGKIHAREVRIFPAAMAGLGEGQYPMDTPKSSMTNATVSAVSTNGTVSASGGTLAMTFHGSRVAGSDVCTGHAAAAGAAGCTGTTSLVVDSDVPVTALFMGDPSLLKPGLAVSALVAVGSDSRLAARFLTVEKDGVKPVR